jgi:hypothetical protein
MKIEINDHRKIFAVQEAFSTLFPRLRIEFLGKPNHLGSSPSTKTYASSKTIGDCRIEHATGELTVTPSMTVADLKQSLSDEYGLSILVLRQSGTQWVETTNNNSWSLQEQNDKTDI